MEIPFGKFAAIPLIDESEFEPPVAEEPLVAVPWLAVEDVPTEEFSKAATICSIELIICDRTLPPLPAEVPAPCAKGLAPGLMLKIPTERPLGKLTSIPAEASKPRLVGVGEDPAEVV